jgi:SOS response regulatory protein OraA/RecX
MKKSLDNTIIVNAVMEEMSAYISEERTVDGLVRMYVEQSKTRPYIEQKLRAKKFAKEVILSTLDTYTESFMSWNMYEQTITQKVLSYIQKNKSRRYIIGTLTQKYPNFKQNILVLLDQIIPDEMESIQEEYIKLAKKFDSHDTKERQKIVQKLSMKGFSYDGIKKVMRNEE